MVDAMEIVKDANLPEFAAITGGLLLSEYLEKPMTDWGFDADTRNLARLLGGEAIAFSMNTLAPKEEYSPSYKYKPWLKGFSYVFTAVAADGTKRYLAPVLGIVGAPKQVIIKQAPPQRRNIPAPAQSQIPARQVVQPAIKVGTELSDDELRNLGFLR